MVMTTRIAGVLAIAVALGALAAPAAAQDTPRARYERAMARERSVRAAADPSLADIRAAVSQYEALVRRFPASGYCDNALWQAAGLESLAFEKYADEADRRAVARLLSSLREQYPASSLIDKIDN